MLPLTSPRRMGALSAAIVVLGGLAGCTHATGVTSAALTRSLSASAPAAASPAASTATRPPSRPPAAHSTAHRSPAATSTSAPAPTGPTASVSPVTSGPATTTSPPPAVHLNFPAALAQLAAERGGGLSVAVRWPSGAVEYFGSGLRFRTASILKVDILATLLAQGHLDDADVRRYAPPMIERSDNDAATTLWRDAGRHPGLAAFNRTVGFSGTTYDAATLYEPWDGVMTSAADQLRLLEGVAYPGTALTAAERRYATDLMAAVEADQRWGVSAAVPAGDPLVLKNGWVPVGGQGWTVNSMGCALAAPAFCLVVLSSGSPSMQYGIDTVQAVARLVARRLPYHS